jgi:hypothetical protein
MKFALGIVDSADTSWEAGFAELEGIDSVTFDQPVVNRGRLDDSAILFGRALMEEIAQAVRDDQVCAVQKAVHTLKGC